MSLNSPFTPLSLPFTPQTFDAVILGDGDFPRHDVPLAVLRGCPYLCCCDRAGMEAMKRGFHVDAIVGDGDSLPPSFAALHRDILHLESGQEDNDQTKATRFCAAMGFRRIAYLGATGRREDHTIGNISLLCDYRNDFGVRPTMITDHGMFIAARGESTFSTRQGQPVSVFNATCSQLTGSGLRWQLRPFDRLWQGTLNEALGETVTVNGDGDYLVYLAFASQQ